MEYHGPGRRALAIILVIVLLLGLFGVGTSAAQSHTAAIHDAAGSSIAVTASTGFKVTPAYIANVSDSNSTANDTIVFTNGDTLAHTWTLSSRQGFVIPSSDSPDQLVAFFKQYPPLFSLPAGGPSFVNGTFPAPPKGWYEFVCNESGHFQQGMYGFIAFGEGLPGNLTVSALYDGPGAAVFIIVGTIVTLTVIAIVLGFVVGRRRGSHDEMPPERLGYPEPPNPAEPAPPPRLPPTH
jgi:plastocyanin